MCLKFDCVMGHACLMFNHLVSGDSHYLFISGNVACDFVVVLEAETETV